MTGPKLDKSLDLKVTDGPDGSIQVPSYASDVASLASKASLDTKLDKSLDSRKGMWVVKNPAALGRRAFVDWRNTFEVGETIPKSHIEAIQPLQQKGWYVFMACFCGPKREQKVRITLATLRAKYNLALDEVVFYRDPTGEVGKANGALAKGVNVLVDDRDDICKEALAKRLKVYPIMKRGQTHSWAEQAFASFAAAAQQMLQDHP